MFKRMIMVCVVSVGLCGCSTISKWRHGDKHQQQSAHESGSEQAAQSQGWQRDQDWQQSGVAEAKNTVVLFAFDKDIVSAADQHVLQQQARYLEAHPRAMVRVIGHTDERGSREYNMGLGWRRAKAVALQLQQDGVPKRQMDVTSFGAEKPVMLGHNETAYRQNRRVQVIYKRY